MKSVELVNGTSAVALTRANYNVWVLSGTNTGSGPYTFRVTDIYNNVVTDKIALQSGGTVTGTAQFPACQ